MAEKQEIWPKSISVDKRIVRILSASTYDNFPNALKEMITNAYDADATSVDIKIDRKNETIIIHDTGVGMSETDFSIYLRIAGVKREKKKKTNAGRHVIGQFGVGFLSVFPFFKNFSIETTKKGSSEILKADIPCYMYFGQNSIDISEIKVAGGIQLNKARENQQYTIIKLSGFTELTNAFFYPTKKNKPRQDSILNEDSLEVLKWRLSEDLPIKYSDTNLNKIFDKFSPNLPFDVNVDGIQLLRKTYGREILEIHKGDFNQIGKIKFRYYIATDREAINNPIEGRFLKIRNLNVGVGERTTFGLGTEFGGARSRLQWLTGEVHIVEGMNDLITVARDKFNYDVDYENLKEFFIKRLSFHSNQLEAENTVTKFLENTKDSSSIKNIKLLDKRTLNKKIIRLEKGKSEKDYIEETINIPINSKAARLPNKSEIDLFEKKITIEGKTYKVLLESWDYKNDFYPALKIEERNLVINGKYPLFRGTKHTDTFIKFHFLLLNNLKKGNIKKDNFREMALDVLKIFKDYI